MYNNNYFDNYMIPAIMPKNDIFNQASDGFLKGNMEKGTYVPYKNYTYIKPVITSEKDKMLYDVQEACFAKHEANLYLDINPNDKYMIEKFKGYNEMADNLTNEYEKKYGPIDLSDNNSIKNNLWNWIDNPWPWNK